MKNRTFIFRGALGEVAVDLWDGGPVQVRVRNKPSDIWSPALELLREEGDPVHIAFEMETDPGVGVGRDYCVVHESRRWGRSNFCEKSVPEGSEGRECKFGGE